MNYYSELTSGEEKAFEIGKHLALEVMRFKVARGDEEAAAGKYAPDILNLLNTEKPRENFVLMAAFIAELMRLAAQPDIKLDSPRLSVVKGDFPRNGGDA
jgi:hypothetical protein